MLDKDNVSFAAEVTKNIEYILLYSMLKAKAIRYDFILVSSRLKYTLLKGCCYVAKIQYRC